MLLGYLLFRLPEWTKSVFPNGECKWIFDYLLFRVWDKTPELARLGVGFMLAEICENFLEIKNGTNQQQAFRLYSDHDTSISNLLWALGFKDIVIVSLLIISLQILIGEKNFSLPIFINTDRTATICIMFVIRTS